MEKLIALLLMGLLFHAAESVQRCDRSNTDPCNEAAITVVLGTQTQFPDVRFLNAYCSNMNTTIDCIVDEATECPNSRNKDVLAEYVEIQRIIHEICTEGSKFRKSYLESVPCYNRNLDKLRNCSSSIHADVTGFRSSESGVEKPFELRSPFKYECIKRFVIPNCQIRVTAEDCDMKAANILREITYGASDLLIKTFCTEEQMAVWLDEYRTYVVESRKPQVVETCVTEIVETQTTANHVSDISDLIGTTSREGTNIRDAIFGLIKTSKERVTSTQRKSKETVKPNDIHVLDEE